MRNLIGCSTKFYGMQVSMTQQSEDFQRPIFTTITHNLWLFEIMAHVFRPITEPSERETMPSRIAFYSQLLKHNTVAGVNSNSLNIFWSLVALTTGCNVQYVESLPSPRGHYFASASHDRTARLWSTDQPRLLRIFAGQVSDVNVWEKFVVISYK